MPLENGRHLVYAPLRRAAFVTNAHGVNRVAALQHGDGAEHGDEELLEVLRTLEMVDSGPDPVPSDVYSGDPNPTAITLFLTTACNLRCHYCYASAGETPLERMSLATALRGIDFVLANAVQVEAPGIGITYHGGGEPTLNWSVLTGSLEYARAQAGLRGLAVTATAASNGVLRDAQVDWIIANLDGVNVSFDGLPTVHDAQRPTATGRSSSADVTRTLERFDAAGFSYGIRVTVTAEQIPSLPASIEFICSRFEPSHIQVEPAYQLGRWSTAPTTETEEFVAAYREARVEAARHGRDLIYSAARLGVITNHFCGVTRDSFALSPAGNVSACYEVFSERNPLSGRFFYGKPDGTNGGYSFDLAVLDSLRQQAVRHHEFCEGCFAKWSCAGDCYHKALSVSGTGRFEGSDRCHITRELTKDQILDAIAASGGLFWHAGTGSPSEEVAS